DAHAASGAVASAPRPAAVSGGVYAVLLGGGNMVDTAAAYSDGLAPRRHAVSVPLRAAILGHGVSARHVHHRHSAAGRGAAARFPHGDTPRLRLAGGARLAHRLRWDAPSLGRGIR